MEVFHQLLLDYPEVMYGGVGVTAFVASGTLIYKIATRLVQSQYLAPLRLFLVRVDVRISLARKMCIGVSNI